MSPLVELRDAQIRRILREGLSKRLANQPQTTIVDELGLQGGKVRADVSVISPSKLVGYEIKSDFDSLNRLERQQAYYCSVFDECYLICGHKYVNKVKVIIPDWWGIYAIGADPLGKVRFYLAREAGLNPNPKPGAIVRLLWRDEAYAELKKIGRSRGMSSATRRAMHAKLVEMLSHEDLREAIARQLATRPGWR